MIAEIGNCKNNKQKSNNILPDMTHSLIKNNQLSS